MPTLSRSFATPDGNAYFKHTGGRYKELTKRALGRNRNDAPPSSKQKKLVEPNDSESDETMEAVKKDLGLK